MKSSIRNRRRSAARFRLPAAIVLAVAALASAAGCANLERGRREPRAAASTPPPLGTRATTGMTTATTSGSRTQNRTQSRTAPPVTAASGTPPSQAVDGARFPERTGMAPNIPTSPVAAIFPPLDLLPESSPPATAPTSATPSSTAAPAPRPAPSASPAAPVPPAFPVPTERVRPVAAIPVAPAAAKPAAAPERRTPADLLSFVRQDCGSCHGLTMKGGLGTPLTAQALAGKPRESLIAVIAQGRPGTAMPGWAPLLHPQDIEWIVDRLLEGLPAQ